MPRAVSTMSTSSVLSANAQPPDGPCGRRSPAPYVDVPESEACSGPRRGLSERNRAIARAGMLTKGIRQSSSPVSGNNSSSGMASSTTSVSIAGTGRWNSVTGSVFRWSRSYVRNHSPR